MRVIKIKGIMVILEPTDKTKYWKNSQLNKHSQHFDETVFNEKMNRLQYGRKIILHQRVFSILEDECEPHSCLRYYVLKRK